MLRKRLHAEDGVALLTALLAVIILSGLALVFVSRAITESRASGSASDYEMAVHATEAASDQIIRQLNRHDEYVSRDKSDTEISAPADGADERQWTLDLHLADDRVAGTENWITTDDGEAYAVRPLVDGEPGNVIYAAGAVPSFDADRNRTRVLRLKVDQDHYQPDYALLSDGKINMRGSAAIVAAGCDLSAPDADCNADVHTNQSYSGSSSTTVHGQVSSAGGTCSADGSVVDCVGAEDGVERQPIPNLEARNFYRPDETLNPDPEGRDMGWFDLCPDETVRAGSTGTPCSSTEIIWSSNHDTTDFRGWTYQSTGNWNGWRANPIGAGAFYVYHADVRIRGNTEGGRRAASVFVETDDTRAGRTGSLDISGEPKLEPALGDVLFITDRDFVFTGGTLPKNSNTSCEDRMDTQFSGFIGVGEQVYWAGNAQLHGAMVVQDEEDKHDLVKRDANDEGLRGEMCLDFNSEMVIDILGYWVITFWNEMFSGGL